MYVVLGIDVIFAAQKVWQRVPELEKSTAVAMEKMKLEEAARRKLEERLITVSLSRTALSHSMNGWDKYS